MSLPCPCRGMTGVSLMPLQRHDRCTRHRCTHAPDILVHHASSLAFAFKLPSIAQTFHITALVSHPFKALASMVSVSPEDTQRPLVMDRCSGAPFASCSQGASPQTCCNCCSSSSSRSAVPGHHRGKGMKMPPQGSQGTPLLRGIAAAGPSPWQRPCLGMMRCPCRTPTPRTCWLKLTGWYAGSMLDCLFNRVLIPCWMLCPGTCLSEGN